MSATDFSNLTDLKKQDVADFVQAFFENNAPGWNAFTEAVKDEEITEKGYRLPYFSRRPGGHTGFIPSDSSFNAAVPPQTQSMYVMPVPYALPEQFYGMTLRSFQKDTKNNVAGLTDIYKQYVEAATKRINQMFYGDGSGALAYSASTLAVLGSNTLAGTTAAATTPGQTKGTYRLEEGHTYQAWNTTTGAVRGTFTVTTPGKTSCTINLLSGSISSGDPITDVRSYNRYIRGLGHLISDQTRTLQGLNTGVFTDLNASVVDLAGTNESPASVETLKATINTRNNTEDAEAKLMSFGTPGAMSNLRKQGYSLGWYDRGADSGDTMKGVQKRYADGDTVFINDADAEGDRRYLVQAEQVGMWTLMPMGEYNLDGLEWRMAMGDNGTGSDTYSRAIGIIGNPGIMLPRACGFSKRAGQTGVVDQTS